MFGLVVQLDSHLDCDMYTCWHVEAYTWTSSACTWGERSSSFVGLLQVCCTCTYWGTRYTPGPTSLRQRLHYHSGPTLPLIRYDQIQLRPIQTSHMWPYYALQAHDRQCIISAVDSSTADIDWFFWHVIVLICFEFRFALTDTQGIMIVAQEKLTDC